jgi:3-dehydroquinate synthase
MTSIIHVNLAQDSYKIVSAAGCLDNLGALIASTYTQSRGLGQSVIVVSNPIIFRHYGLRVINSLEAAGFTVNSCILPAGERHKTLASVEKIYNTALKHRLERSDTLVALGGGVIGDITGFAAATWLRGINLVQVPTSLLAMVDSAVGGKTGVNHPQGKNLIGAFHQPRLVAIDPEVLSTLPAREFRAGLAEVIKYGVIWDADLFYHLEAATNLSQLRFLRPELLQLVIERSCKAKANIVEQDEKESSLRALLNYGHTIGHAIESLTRYRQFKHGEAVALGMLAASEIAVASGTWSRTEAKKLLALIQKAGLPTAIPTELDVSAIVKALSLDKKVKNGKVRFILPVKIGEAFITDQVSPEIVTLALHRLRSLTVEQNSLSALDLLPA